eukprot:CAMPEP_0201592720 /NCGR_PEP_ID=MMETSP0190_2-20130828/190541_1 /ASSEMBLY_ACC=CAM_ASM_000263 /TAXON_ID=37353 /ORGANISM="Rosalina sp." /LENGTH=217 /DNA_ID=CAMNT_0048051623 /DNA_START=549 /DNA_END=1198 /DNA_ORIENTATION=+
MSPTPYPTPNPTPSPTPEPTITGYKESNVSTTMIYNVIVAGGGDGGSSSSGGWSGYDCDGIIGPNDDSAFMDDGIYGQDVCIQLFDLAIFGYDCDDISGPNEESTFMDQGIFGTDVCIGIFDLGILDVDSDDFSSTTSIGWYCDESKGYYFMSLFKDTSCTIQYSGDDFDGSNPIIAYHDDSCLPYDDDYATFWTTVECDFYDGETGTTKSPQGNSG